MYIFLTPLLLLQPVFAQIERKEFVVKRRGGTEIFDETVSSNPRSFDYDFDGDLRHAADRNDLYDEFVGQLPDFNLYKLGKDRGTTMVPVVTRQWDTWFTPVPSRDDFALAATTPSSRLQEKTSEPLTKIEEKPSFAESPPPLLVQNRKISKETEFTTSTGTSTIIPTTIETTTPAPTATSLQPSPSTVKKFTGHSKKSTIRPSTVETTTSEASTEQPSPTTVKKFTAHSKKSTIRPSTVETTTSEASTEQPSPTTVKKFTAHSKKSTIRPTTLETTTPEASTEKLSPTTVKKFTIKWTETSHLRRTTRPTTVAPVSTTEPPTTSALPTSSSTFSVEPLQKERPIWRPTRPPQPKPVFTFATIMGVRRQKLTTTVSPRPGGIWRRGRIIFEDDTTTTSSPSTTTARATATAPNKSTKSYNREQASEEHLSIDQRVESAATATTTSEDFTRSPQLQRRPSRLLQRLELEKGHQDAPASTQQTVAPKPVVIQQGSERYKGPTFNCRILNPFEDGVATANHDPSCPMAMPGLSKDGSCRCFYTVSSRDENGCATGFFYACKPLWNFSVVV